MPDLSKTDEVIRGVSFLARTRLIDRIVALDDYDVWTAANLREHLRLPGMGDTSVRYFRDKLAMRVKAQQHGILVPDFVHVLAGGRIVRSGGKELALQLEKEGYGELAPRRGAA